MFFLDYPTKIVKRFLFTVILSEAKNLFTNFVHRFYVQMKADPYQWITWAYENDIHPWITEYIGQRPDHLFSEPPKTEEPYSTPRSWHMLSDALKEYGAGEKSMSDDVLRMLTYGCISAKHAGMFVAYTKQLGNRHLLNDIIKGEASFPSKPLALGILNP